MTNRTQVLEVSCLSRQGDIPHTGPHSGPGAPAALLARARWRHHWTLSNTYGQSSAASWPRSPMGHAPPTSRALRNGTRGSSAKCCPHGSRGARRGLAVAARRRTRRGLPPRRRHAAWESAWERAYESQLRSGRSWTARRGSGTALEAPTRRGRHDKRRVVLSAACARPATRGRRSRRSSRRGLPTRARTTAAARAGASRSSFWSRGRGSSSGSCAGTTSATSRSGGPPALLV